MCAQLCFSTYSTSFALLRFIKFQPRNPPVYNIHSIPALNLFSIPHSPLKNKSFSKKMADLNMGLVIDNGSDTIKAGFAGEDAPW